MNKELTVEELRAIIRKEMDYWNALDSDLAIGAVGACANILAASFGILAPWHKPKE